MANTFAVLSQQERDLAAADKPFLGTNALVVTDRFVWRTQGTFNTGADDTDANFPTSRMIDNKSNLVSQPSAVIGPNEFILIDTSSAPIEFDFFGVLNHNLGSTLGGGLVGVQIADDEDFSTGFKSLGNILVASGDDKRLTNLVLDHVAATATRYSNVEFIRVQLAGFSAAKPFVGELFFGRRRQLEFKPTLPYGPDNLGSDVDDFVSKTRVTTRHVRTKGFRELTANLNPSTDPFRTDLITFFEDESDFGTVPFVWIEDPNARPREFNWMFMDPPSFNFPLVGPFERNLQLVATEQGPDFLALDKF